MAERRLKGPDPGGIRDDRPLDPVHRKVDHGFLPLQRGSLRVGIDPADVLPPLKPT